MANIYVRNGAATPTSPYNSWATAAANIFTAVGGATPSDTIWVADDHLEDNAASVTWACPTSPGLRILGAGTHTIAPPVEISITSIVNVSGTLTIHGYVYLYGLTLNIPGGGASSIRLGFVGGLQCGVIAEACTFFFGVTGSAQTLALGGINSGGVGATYIKLINPIVRFAAASHWIKVDSGRVHIDNMMIDSSSAIPTTLFNVGSNSGPSADLLVENSDLSGKTFTNLLTVASNVNPSNMVVQNCKIPGLTGWITGSLGAYGAQRLMVYNTDLADTHINFREQDYSGVVETDAATYRTGGAQQADTTSFSWKMTGLPATTFLYPLRSTEVVLWNTITGVSQTATVEILRDNVTALKDNEVWLELIYYSVSGFPIGRTVSDRIPTVIASPANQTTSTATWINSMTNPNKQKLVVTFTAQEVGYIKARVCVAINTTVYVDPFITKA